MLNQIAPAEIDYEKLWSDALAELELEVSRPNFLTWFKKTCITRCDREVIYVAVPNAFVRDWLYNKYHKSILRAIRKNLDSVRQIEYIITKEPVKEIRPQSQQNIVTNQLEIQEVYINKEDNLNPRYIFDSFIVGPFNELAYAAAQAVIRNPGVSYNPLFIYGGTGLGKTHLIQAIGNYFKKLDANKKIYYLSSEKYGVEYVEAVRNNKVHFFKEKYRKYDILIMDDVQFFSGKEKTQEEIFHLFNLLYENNKQIVFSSDKAPKYIPGIEDRLKSRFEGGMMADINPPDYESRFAILKAKTKQAQIDIAEEVLEYVASVVQNNIRELEGIFNSILVQTQLKKKGLVIQEIKALIKNSVRPPKSITINDVIKTIANFYNINENMLYAKTRKKEVVKPRQVVMYLLREDLNASYPYIGQKLGGRDHTTAIHAYEKIKGDLVSNNSLAQEIEQIKALLYGEN